MRKAMGILLIVILFVLALISCSESSNNEVFDVDLGDTDSELIPNFGGKQFCIIGEERLGRIELNPYETYEDSAWTERLKKRYDEISKKYNISFSFTRNSNGLAQCYAAGLPWADLYDARTDGHWPNLIAGLYNSLTDIPGFLSGIEEGKWGPTNIVESYKRGDDYYLFYPGFHGIPFPQMGGVFYANLTVLRQFGFNIFEIIESGNWTWDTFKNILVTIGGIPNDENSVFGMYYQTSFPDYFLTTLILNNGGSLVREDSDGRIINNLNSKEVEEAIQFAQELRTEGIVATQNNDDKYPTFIENRLAFIYEYTYVGTVDVSGNGFMYNDVDFAIVPCPAGPSAKYGEWKAYLGYADRMLSVPVTADMDMINSILSELYSPLGDNPFEWREVYARQNFIHEESANYYFMMFDNALPDYFPAIRDNYAWSAILAGSKTYSEVYESSKDKIQQLLDKYYNDFNS